MESPDETAFHIPVDRRQISAGSSQLTKANQRSQGYGCFSNQAPVLSRRPHLRSVTSGNACTSCYAPRELIRLTFRSEPPAAPEFVFTGVTVEYKLGRPTPPHGHGDAFVAAYVLSGAVIVKVDDSPERVFPPERAGLRIQTLTTPSAGMRVSGRMGGPLNALGTSPDVQREMMRHGDARTAFNYGDVYGDVATDEMTTAGKKVAQPAFQEN